MRRLAQPARQPGERTALAAVVAVTALAYANALGNGFAFDDRFVLVDNEAIRDLSNLPRFFSDPATGASIPSQIFYRPVRTTLYALVYAVAGLSPWIYHALNVGLHLVDAVLVFRVVSRLGARLPLATWVAACFGVHPLTTEAVASVTGMTDTLFACFYLAALLLHLTRVRSSASILARLGVVGLYSLALGSKEMAATFPLVVILTDRLVPQAAGSSERRRHTAYLSVLFLVTLAFVALRTQLLGLGQAAELPGATVGRTLAMQATVLVDYLRLIFVPVGLSVRHSVPIPLSCLDVEVVVSALVLAGLVAGAVCLRRRSPLAAWGIAWFLIVLLPVMNLVPIRGSMFGERFCYLPLVGILLAVGSPIAAYSARCSRRVGRALLALALIGIATLGGMTVERNRDWADTITLLEAAVRVAPDSNAIRLHLYREYMRLGRQDLATVHYRAGVENTRAHAEHFWALGDRAFERGRSDEAAFWYARALQLDESNLRDRQPLEELGDRAE